MLPLPLITAHLIIPGPYWPYWGMGESPEHPLEYFISTKFGALWTEFGCLSKQSPMCPLAKAKESKNAIPYLQ